MNSIKVVDESEVLDLSRICLPQLQRFVLSCIVSELELHGELVQFIEIATWHLESATDRDHYSAIFDSIPKFTGPLYISSLVTDKTDRKLHLISSDYLQEYICEHRRIHSEVFFNLDCVVFSPEMRRWLLIHHNGLYADVIVHLSCPT